MEEIDNGVGKPISIILSTSTYVIWLSFLLATVIFFQGATKERGSCKEISWEEDRIIIATDLQDFHYICFFAWCKY